jgi:hypothetical protein
MSVMAKPAVMVLLQRDTDGINGTPDMRETTSHALLPITHLELKVVTVRAGASGRATS